MVKRRAALEIQLLVLFLLALAWLAMHPRESW